MLIVSHFIFMRPQLCMNRSPTLQRDSPKDKLRTKLLVCQRCFRLQVSAFIAYKGVLNMHVTPHVRVFSTDLLVRSYGRTHMHLRSFMYPNIPTNRAIRLCISSAISQARHLHGGSGRVLWGGGGGTYFTSRSNYWKGVYHMINWLYDWWSIVAIFLSLHAGCMAHEEGLHRS